MAGSGPYALKSWKAVESVVLDANAAYRSGAPALKRVVIRHIPEPAAQRLLIEKGDADIARDLSTDQINGIEGNAGYFTLGTEYMITRNWGLGATWQYTKIGANANKSGFNGEFNWNANSALLYATAKF